MRVHGLDANRQQIGAAEELRGEAVGRLAIEAPGRPEGDQPAVAHDGDAIGERQRLGLVVGDVEHRQRRQLAMQPRQLLQHVAADLRVERRERLVQQQHARPDRQRASDRHPLLLAAAELARVASRIVQHADHAQAFAYPLAHDAVRDAAGAQAEGDVLVDPHVRKEGVVLHHHADVAGMGRQVGHVALADADAPARPAGRSRRRRAAPWSCPSRRAR